MHRASRVGRERFVGDEVDARGAERKEGRAGRRHADAGGTGRVVAGAACHHHAIWVTPGHTGTLTSAMPFAVGVPSLLMAVSVQRVTGPGSLTSARRINVSSG